tara:strand:+ start:329 stop:1582 length:1254 start_codon:yes stop_codon:yes gene_type:complete
MKFIKILNLKKTDSFTVAETMLDFYLNKKYSLFNSYPKYLLKINIFIDFLKRIKIKFKNPPKKNFLIFDCENDFYLKQLMPRDEFGVMSTRISKIYTVYISVKLLFYITINFLKRSVKQNYIAGLIKIISPKIVVTHIDLSSDFHSISKALLDTNIRFITVSVSHLTAATIINNKKFLENSYIPEFLCFSDYDKKLLQKFNVKKFTAVGSLKPTLAKEFIIKNKIKINPKKYDICLVGEPEAEEGDFLNFNEVITAPGYIAEYTHRLCNEYNLNLIFSAKFKPGTGLSSDLEKYYYDNFLQKYNYRLVKEHKNYGTYINIMQSKLIIGHASTTLRESFTYKKKILAWNYTNSPDVCMPTKGISEIGKCSYKEFKDRVLEILNMSYQDYIGALKEDPEYSMVTKIDTIQYFKQLFKTH